MAPNHFHQRNAIWIIFLAALVLRLTYIIFVPQLSGEELGDSWVYDDLALSLRSGEGYLEDVRWPPLYPTFLCGVYLIFGHGFFAVRIIQAVISSVSCVFIYLVARRCLTAKVALSAGLFSVFYPAFISYAGIPLTETLGTFLLLSFIYCLLSSLSSKKTLWLLAAGLSGGLLILCRSEMLLLGVFIILGMYILRQFNRDSFVKVIAIVLLSFLVCVPWTVRNYLLFDKFIPITARFNSTLWVGSYPEEWTEWHYDREPLKSLNCKTVIELDAKLGKLAFKNITTHPFIYVKLCVKKFFRFWIGGHSNTFKGLHQALSNTFGNLWVFLPKFLLLLLNLFLILSGFYGIFLSIKRHLNLCLILTLVIAYKAILHTILFSAPRYQLLVMPYMIILAVYAWDELFKHNYEKLT